LWGPGYRKRRILRTLIELVSRCEREGTDKSFLLVLGRFSSTPYLAKPLLGREKALEGKCPAESASNPSTKP